MKKTLIIFTTLALIALAGCVIYQKYNQFLPTAPGDVQFPPQLGAADIQRLNQHTPIDLVRVYKSQRILQLISNNQLIRQYPMRLGFAPIGHKIQEGDGKTPEGRYTLDWRNPQSAFYKSFHVSYPNAADRAKAQSLGVSPGGDIMIHGSASTNQMKLNENLIRYFPRNDWTWGCIAIRNIDIDELWLLIKDGTPIEILP